MPPPKEKGSRTGKNFKDFDPNTVGKDDRLMFNLRSQDGNVVYNFIVFIVQLRFCAALGGLKFTGEKFDQKLCLGYAESYKIPFMIASVCFEGLHEVEFLIYKPSVYNVGFCINKKWWRVTDFSAVTEYNFPDSNELLYDSSYKLGVPTRFSFHIFQNSIINVFNSCHEASFRSLCVILCETMRFDEILRVIGGSLGKDNNGVRKVVDLNAKHTKSISNWNHTSGLWYLYDMGFEWDPLHLYPELVFQDAESCSMSLGLAMKTEKKFEFYIEKLRKLSKEEREEKQRRQIHMKGF